MPRPVEKASLDLQLAVRGGQIYQRRAAYTNTSRITGPLAFSALAGSERRLFLVTKLDQPASLASRKNRW